MAKLYLQSYNHRSSINAPPSQHHRQDTETVVAGSNIFFAKDWEKYDRGDGTFGLQAGDVLGIGLAPCKCVPAWFVSSCDSDPNDFSFQLGLGAAGSEEPIENQEAFFCTIDPLASPDDTAPTIPLGNNLREPKNMMRSDMARMVQTFGKSVLNDPLLKKLRISALDFEIMLTVLVPPTVWDFSVQWNWLFPVRSYLTAARV